MLSVSICVACYKNDPFLSEAINSCQGQYYPNEVIVYNDDVGIGTGEAFNKAIEKSTRDIIVLLCSDDVFTDKYVISDIVAQFDNPEVGHVSRWYHQFVGTDRRPVRAWRGENIIELANNPSGMAFRRKAIFSGENLTNKMFVEVAFLVNKVIERGWAYSILRYDTVAVRIHNSISRTPGYYKKMWNSSPVEEWAKLGWETNDFTHLIQVGVNFDKKAVAQEACQFLNVNFWNAFNPCFWFFFMVALWTPRDILYKIPEIYRATWGRLTTRKLKRI